MTAPSREKAITTGVAVIVFVWVVWLAKIGIERNQQQNHLVLDATYAAQPTEILVFSGQIWTTTSGPCVVRRIMQTTEAGLVTFDLRCTWDTEPPDTLNFRGSP